MGCLCCVAVLRKRNKYRVCQVVSVVDKVEEARVLDPTLISLFIPALMLFEVCQDGLLLSVIPFTSSRLIMSARIKFLLQIIDCRPSSTN